MRLRDGIESLRRTERKVWLAWKVESAVDKAHCYRLVTPDARAARNFFDILRSARCRQWTTYPVETLSELLFSFFNYRSSVLGDGSRPEFRSKQLSFANLSVAVARSRLAPASAIHKFAFVSQVFGEFAFDGLPSEVSRFFARAGAEVPKLCQRWKGPALATPRFGKCLRARQLAIASARLPAHPARFREISCARNLTEVAVKLLSGVAGYFDRALAMRAQQKLKLCGRWIGLTVFEEILKASGLFTFPFFETQSSHKRYYSHFKRGVIISWRKAPKFISEIQNDHRN